MTTSIDGRCNLWIERSGSPGAQSRFRPEDAVPTKTTGSICNGFHTLTVGAYDAHDPGRPLGSFSSGGPTGDGRTVPVCVAPGVRVVAARSTPAHPGEQPALLTTKSGTSEAAPHLAGLIACMYEIAGPLPVREVRRLILQNTEAPPPGADEEPYRWGLGYLDVERVLAATRATYGSGGKENQMTTETSERWPEEAEPAPYYSRRPDLLAAPLAPSVSLAVDSTWPGARRRLARTYNRLGGLFTLVAERLAIDVPGLLAVWQVESGGRDFTPGRAIVRFENHLLWRRWGHSNPERFDSAFQFGTHPPLTDPQQCGRPFRCHRYRPPAGTADPAPQWRPVHSGNQDDEYAALALARELAGDQHGFACISIGGPQILITNFARLGYGSPSEMYDAFQRSEAAHVLGFARFLSARRGGRRPAGPAPRTRLDRLRQGLQRAGQVETYAEHLSESYAQAVALLRDALAPATRAATPESAGDSLLATAVPRSGARSCDVGRNRTAPGQLLDLGDGLTAEVLGAPRDPLALPVREGDLAPADRPRRAHRRIRHRLRAAARSHRRRPRSRSQRVAAARTVAVQVTEDSGPFLRRLLNASGRLPLGQAVLRPVLRDGLPTEDTPDTLDDMIRRGRTENEITDTLFGQRSASELAAPACIRAPRGARRWVALRDRGSPPRPAPGCCRQDAVNPVQLAMFFSQYEGDSTRSGRDRGAIPHPAAAALSAGLSAIACCPGWLSGQAPHRHRAAAVQAGL
ncbi:N-acetylmuramidase domain-containing protein [Streptomyces sp. L7]